MSCRRYIKSRVRSKTFELSKTLAFLKKASFITLIEERSSTGSTWSVELSAKSFKSLLTTKQRYKESATTIADLKFEIKRLKSQMSKIKHERDIILRQHNEFARQVVKEDGTFTVPNSTKSYLNVAEEQGTNLGRPGIQGGLAGLEKK